MAHNSAKKLITLACAFALVVGVGCKKDEPVESSEAAPQAEKVDKAEPSELGTRKGALSDDTDSKKNSEKSPRERKLVKKKSSDDKGDDEPSAKSARAKKEPAKPRRAVKVAAADDEDGDDDEDDEADEDDEDEAEPAGKRSPRLAKQRRAVRPLRGAPPTARTVNRGEAASTDDEDEGEDAGGKEADDDEVAQPEPVAGRLGPRGRSGGMGPRVAGAVPPTGRSPRNVRRAGAAEPQEEPPIQPRIDARTPPTLSPAVRTALPTRVRPNAELLLRKEDIAKVLMLRFDLDVHALVGLDSSDEYDGVYWGSADGSKYVAGIQVWRPRSPIEAQRRYTQMVRSYPNAEETTAVTNKTFLAYWNDFIYLAFFDSGKQAVVSLTCHRKMCDSPQKLMQLATTVKERL